MSNVVVNAITFKDCGIADSDQSKKNVFIETTGFTQP